MLSEGKDFLKALPGMKIFRFYILIIFLGSVLGGFFFYNVLHTSFVVVIVGVLYASVITIIIGTYICFQVYSGKIWIPADQERGRSLSLREIVATIPLLLGAIVTLYFVATDRLKNIAPVLLFSVAIWLVLRFFIGRMTRRSSC